MLRVMARTKVSALLLQVVLFDLGTVRPLKTRHKLEEAPTAQQ